MEKIYIDVPFDHKELAKSLGAKWDGNKKQWYIGSGSALEKVYSWLPEKVRVVEKSIELSEHSIVESFYKIPCRFKTDKDVADFMEKQGLVYVKRGFCGYCDSTMSNEWSDGGKCCLHHFKGGGIPINSKEERLFLEYIKSKE